MEMPTGVGLYLSLAITAGNCCQALPIKASCNAARQALHVPDGGLQSFICQPVPWPSYSASKSLRSASRQISLISLLDFCITVSKDAVTALLPGGVQLGTDTGCTCRSTGV